MRTLLAIGLMCTAAVAGAQVGMLGAGAGLTFELHPEAFPNKDWRRGEDFSPVVSFSLNLSDDTAVRLQARDLSRTTRVGGAPWNGRFRAYTVGADYLLPGTFGQASFSGGVGAYRLDLAGERAPQGVEGQEFGWYVAVGERFQLTHTTRLLGEIVLDRTGHADSPTLLTAALMVAVVF
ncbi:MAG: hypothetical protein HXY19_02355 [Thermoanaerobaculaceae bacterium]|jgi:hypothetical protein|nr:hypothetical protein [Thermoanaerobaculaceae bacterium]